MVPSTSYFKALASIFAIISVTNAHMIMKTPIPYGRGVISNSPLDNSGSDFPCKNLFDMTDPVNDVNHLVPGVPNTLSFTGSAVHGGGSCQVSLTKDLRPTKDSTWMVIKSIEGGCPANVAGNLPADPNGDGASTFQYTVPQGFPEGEYTIAWTWFNKIGNREMYMNCGRANIGNTKKRYAPAKPKVEHRAADYPDILKAQLEIFSCKIPEGTNVAYPNPGPDVQVVASASTMCGGSGSAAPTGDSGSGSSGAASSAVASASAFASSATDSPATTSAAASGFAQGTAAASSGFAATSAPVGTGSSSQSTAAPGVFASGAAPASSAQPTAAASSVATVAPIPAASASSAPASGSGNGSSTPSSGAETPNSPCSEEGAWACSSDGESFQRCASGIWSAPMAVAAGTTCTPGTSMSLNMKIANPGSIKRDFMVHSLHHRREFRLSA